MPADGETAAAGLPLAPQLSQLLIAFTIEFDKEFEHRDAAPHRASVKFLERRECLVVGPDPAGGRARLARLTPGGPAGAGQVPPPAHPR